MMLAPGSLLQGRYRILNSLGSGGFATVYLAQDSRLGGRQVAIKEFNPASIPPADQGWATTAFEQEAMVLGQLSHPGIATVMDFFQSTGLEYLVMEYVPGETLEQAWQQAPGHRFSEEQVLAWVEQICSVLDYLHGQNPPVIFRDLKPSNVIIRPDGTLKLVDFGIARYFKPGQTRDTHTLGTPGYAAPEQYGTGQADARTDVYTLGALTHQLLTGHDPSQTPFNFPPVAKLAPDVSPGAAAAVRQALQTAPLKRFATAGEFGRAMRASTTVLPSTIAKPVNLAAVATIGALVVVIALAVVLISRLYSEDSKVTPDSTSVGHSTPATLSTSAAYLTPADTPSVLAKTEELDTPSRTLTGEVVPQETLPPSSTADEVATEVAGAQAVAATLPSPTGTPYAGMVHVPAGEFTMGISSAQMDAVLLTCRTESSNCPRAMFVGEKPAHTVYLKAFYIDRYEVSNAEFAAFVEATGYRTDAERRGRGKVDVGHDWEWVNGADWLHARGGDRDVDGRLNHPVVLVTWNDAAAYCTWVGGRLPTDAEWEKAARGTDGRMYPWGNSFRCDNANLDDETQIDSFSTGCGDGWLRSAPVGRFPGGVSPHGVHDMAGNVREWVADWYDDGYYEDSPRGNPTGPARGDTKSTRGGSWFSDRTWARVTDRRPFAPDFAVNYVGFRCARDGD